MPTIFRFDGLRVVIYPNDHRPAHVHVVDPESEAVFDLGCPDGPVRLRENFGFRYREISRITKQLSEHRHRLCNEWSKIHGKP